MFYEVIHPSDSLKPYVDHFLIIRNNGDSFDSTRFKVVADGCPGLVFQEDPEAFSDHQAGLFPRLFLHGLTTRHSEKKARGTYCNLVVCLQPQALKRVFGIDANVLTDTYVDLNDVIKNTLTEMLLEAESPAEKIKLLSDFILNEATKRTSSENLKINMLIGQLKHNYQAKSLKEIRSDLAISERLSEQLMNRHVGVSPKFFLRIQRFQSALCFLRDHPSASLTEVCYEYAYTDQSHYIREFQQFAGTTPKQFNLKAGKESLNFSEWPI